MSMDFFTSLNSKGIPLPLLRDNDKRKGSITYTIFVVASVIVACSFIFDILMYGCASIGTCTGTVVYYPKSELLMWFGTAGGLYFGRKTFPSKENKEVISETSN